LLDPRNAATPPPNHPRIRPAGYNHHFYRWLAHDGIANLPQGYAHLTVNHSINFVDPVTGAHTQSIESKWQKFKHKIKKFYGLNQIENYNDYLKEFMWREAFGAR
jgi:hypothetical protein